MRKHQFTKSTSNDFKTIAPSSVALNMHSLGAAHTAGFEWEECLHNVLMPDPLAVGMFRKVICSFQTFYLKFLPLTL